MSEKKDGVNINKMGFADIPHGDGRIPVWSWRDAICKSKMAPSAKLICHTLSTYVSDCGHACFPSVKTLMADTGLGNQAIAKHLRGAVEAGLLAMKRRHNARGHVAGTYYLPCFPKNVDLKREGDCDLDVNFTPRKSDQSLDVNSTPRHPSLSVKFTSREPSLSVKITRQKSQLVKRKMKSSISKTECTHSVLGPNSRKATSAKPFSANEIQGEEEGGPSNRPRKAGSQEDAFGISGKAADASPHCPPSPNPRATRKHAIDPDWKPTDATIAWARNGSIGASDTEIEAELGKFVDHNLAKGQMWADHNRAFQSWMRKAKEYGHVHGIKAAEEAPEGFQDFYRAAESLFTSRSLPGAASAVWGVLTASERAIALEVLPLRRSELIAVGRPKLRFDEASMSDSQVVAKECEFHVTIDKWLYGKGWVRHTTDLEKRRADSLPGFPGSRTAIVRELEGWIQSAECADDSEGWEKWRKQRPHSDLCKGCGAVAPGLPGSQFPQALFDATLANLQKEWRKKLDENGVSVRGAGKHDYEWLRAYGPRPGRRYSVVTLEMIAAEKVREDADLPF